MLTFQRESWADLWRDGQDLFKTHFDELALHKEVMPMGLDNDAYLDVEKRGYLLVVTGRRDGQLIGYFVAMVLAHHPHNKDAGKVSTTDMFYLDPAHRRGGAGARLLKAAVAELKVLGVQKASISTKRHFANVELMQALGWELTDFVFQRTFPPEGAGS